MRGTKARVTRGKNGARRIMSANTLYKAHKGQGMTLCFLCSLSTVCTPWGCCGPVLLLGNPEHYQLELQSEYMSAACCSTWKGCEGTRCASPGVSLILPRDSFCSQSFPDQDGKLWIQVRMTVEMVTYLEVLIFFSGGGVPFSCCVLPKEVGEYFLSSSKQLTPELLNFDSIILPGHLATSEDSFDQHEFGILLASDA